MGECLKKSILDRNDADIYFESYMVIIFCKIDFETNPLLYSIAGIMHQTKKLKELQP